jgi:NAD(P)-dependent dehydrogenase (short-subunit alcohol dehydrogenase family)
MDDTRELAEQLNAGPGAGSATAFAADIGDPESVERLRDNVLKTYGDVDVLVNNAAYNQWIPFADLGPWVSIAG